LYVEHLLVDFFGAHAASEHGGGSEVTTVTGVGSAHHVLGVKHLLGQFGDSQSSVLLTASGSEGGESDHKEMESGEGNQVNCQLPQITVQLSGETETTGDSAHGYGNQMVQVTVSRGSQFQSSETDVVQGLVVNDHSLIGVFDQLMDGKGGVVWLHHSVGHLGGRHHGESLHDSVGVFLSDLADQQSSHSGSSTASQGVHDLEPLKAITALALLSHHIQNGVDQLGSLSVMSLGPIVSGSGLAEDEVVRSEQLSKWTSSHRVHSSWLQIH
jgi:hypothetical protein